MDHLRYKKVFCFDRPDCFLSQTGLKIIVCAWFFVFKFPFLVLRVIVHVCLHFTFFILYPVKEKKEVQ